MWPQLAWCEQEGPPLLLLYEPGYQGVYTLPRAQVRRMLEFVEPACRLRCQWWSRSFANLCRQLCRLSLSFADSADSAVAQGLARGSRVNDRLAELAEGCTLSSSLAAVAGSPVAAKEVGQAAAQNVSLTVLDVWEGAAALSWVLKLGGAQPQVSCSEKEKPQRLPRHRVRALSVVQGHSQAAQTQNQLLGRCQKLGLSARSGFRRGCTRYCQWVPHTAVLGRGCVATAQVRLQFVVFTPQGQHFLLCEVDCYLGPQLNYLGLWGTCTGAIILPKQPPTAAFECRFQTRCPPSAPRLIHLFLPFRELERGWPITQVGNHGVYHMHVPWELRVP